MSLSEDASGEFDDERRSYGPSLLSEGLVSVPDVSPLDDAGARGMLWHVSEENKPVTCKKEEEDGEQKTICTQGSRNQCEPSVVRW